MILLIKSIFSNCICVFSSHRIPNKTITNNSHAKCTEWLPAVTKRSMRQVPLNIAMSLVASIYEDNSCVASMCFNYIIVYNKKYFWIDYPYQVLHTPHISCCIGHTKCLMTRISGVAYATYPLLHQPYQVLYHPHIRCCIRHISAVASAIPGDLSPAHQVLHTPHISCSISHTWSCVICISRPTSQEVAQSNGCNITVPPSEASYRQRCLYKMRYTPRTQSK